MKGFKQNILDFEILDIFNKKCIIFIDTSDYFEIPDSPILEIKLPYSEKIFTFNIDYKNINILNSNNIGLNNFLECNNLADFVDGIYTFTYKICPYKELYITKYHLKSDFLQDIIYEIYSKIECEHLINNAYIKKEILEIQLLLESAKANTIKHNIIKGTKDYELSLKKANKLLNFVNNELSLRKE